MMTTAADEIEGDVRLHLPWQRESVLITLLDQAIAASQDEVDRARELTAQVANDEPVDETAADEEQP